VTAAGFDPKVFAKQATGRINGATPAKAEIDVSALCLSPAEWEAREIEPEDTLLGPFSTTTRTEISADTGLGKTMLGLALAHAKPLGRDFLHWKAVRPGRVLFVDGEMPPSLTKARLRLARQWFGIEEPLGRDKLCILSRDDVEDMPPLDTPEGARWLLDFMGRLGRFDHVTLDNRASLTAGDLAGDDASTQAIKSLQREITKLQTGQLWMHHTGYDGSRGYGRKSREWELDSVALAERLDDRPGSSDVGVRLSFTKYRRRTPDTRADYEPVEIELRDGVWSCERAGDAKVPVKQLGRNQKIVLDAATKLLAASDTKAQPNHPAGNRTVIAVQTLKDETVRSMACDPRHFASRFNDALNGLANARRLGHYDSIVWLP
jgi:hypothetical protein